MLWGSENLSQRSRICVHTHTHTHTHSALKHGDCLRGDTVCRNQTPQPPQGLVITSLVKVSLVRRGSSSAELTPSLTLKEGPLRGVGSAEFPCRRCLSCPWQFLGLAPETLMSRGHEDSHQGGYQSCPYMASGSSPSSTACVASFNLILSNSWRVAGLSRTCPSLFVKKKGRRKKKDLVSPGQRQEDMEVGEGLRGSSWGMAFSFLGLRPAVRGLCVETKPCICSWFRSLSSDSVGVLSSLSNSLPLLGLTLQPPHSPE